MKLLLNSSIGNRPTRFSWRAAPQPPTMADRWADAALILGTLGVVGAFTALPGLICGLIAIIMPGLDWRRARIVEAVGGILLSGFWILSWFPVYQNARPGSVEYTTACANNLKQISLALMAYQQDYDGMLPSSHRWNDTLNVYAKSRQLFQCPLSGDQAGYSMNYLLSGVPGERVIDPAGCVTYFDASVWNGAGGRFLADFRHDGYCNTAFLDGHVKALRPEQMDVATWTPRFTANNSVRPSTAAESADIRPRARLLPSVRRRHRHKSH